MTPGRHKDPFHWWEAIFAVLQAIIAKVQAIWIKHGVFINHTLWAAITLGVVILAVLAYRKRTHCRWWKAIKFGAALLLIRFITFTPLLNLFRRKKIFYLGQGSAMDRWLVNIYPWVWGLSIAALLIINLKKQ